MIILKIRRFAFLGVLVIAVNGCSGEKTEIAPLIAALLGASGMGNTGGGNVTPPPTPSITSVLPATVCQGGSSVTVNGTNFINGAKVIWTGNTTINSPSVVVGSTTQLTAVFPGMAGTPGTTYDLTVENAPGAAATFFSANTVIVGPSLIASDISIVSNLINSRVTLFGAGITQPFPANAVTITPSGTSSPATALLFNNVPGHPNQIQTIVPAGQSAGTYDIQITDASGCSAILSNALTVSDVTTLALDPLPVASASSTKNTWLVLKSPNAPPVGTVNFSDEPTVYLTKNGINTFNAVKTNVVFLDSTTVKFMVPAGTAAGLYDVIAVNPDGSVGVLTAGLTLGTVPTITKVIPSSIRNASGQGMTLLGSNFTAGSVVSMVCRDTSGSATSSPVVVVNSVPTSTNIVFTVDASALPAGALCRLDLKGADGTTAEGGPVAVLGLALSPSVFMSAPSMVTPRRGPGVAVMQIPGYGRYIYAVGGDDGTDAGGLSSVESASIDHLSNISPWNLQSNSLPNTVNFHAAVATDRFIYTLGGAVGGTVSNQVYRAQILYPQESPEANISDLLLGQTGLPAGRWHYRVSALFSNADTGNPNGETLAEFPVTVHIPSLSGGKLAQVVLSWTAPVDLAGVPLPNVSGYRIYRSAVNGASGSEALIATINNAATLTYTDDGSAVPGNTTPLLVGSLGKWHSAATLVTARRNHAAVAVNDGSGNYYIYAMGGLDVASAALTGIEQTAISNPGRLESPGAFAASAVSLSAARHSLGAWVVNSDETSLAGTKTYLYIGGGANAANTAVGSVDYATFTAGTGALSGLTATSTFAVKPWGYSPITLSESGLAWYGGAGGAASAGGANSIFKNPQPGINIWNAAAINMTNARIYAGSAMIPGVAFIAGGKTNSAAATNSVEYIFR